MEKFKSFKKSPIETAPKEKTLEYKEGKAERDLENLSNKLTASKEFILNQDGISEIKNFFEENKNGALSDGEYDSIRKKFFKENPEIRLLLQERRRIEKETTIAEERLKEIRMKKAA